MTEEIRREILNKEIDLIQACITRMANNSFLVKGWLITLIAVVLALLPKTFNIKILCIVGLVACGCFWYLDGFFLKMEKLYRWKYEWVICNRLKNDSFCYDLNPYNTEMWIHNSNGNCKVEPSVVKIMFTKTLFPLYLPIISTVLFLLINSFVNLF
ncbi:hypothetical protein Ga0466249_000357 [Sporomusaceae bacterium BoRhaA]|uniref:hypothetical protein n=1 Tax=Pelorhabdus rhamnosifermentans TaxID=2772457 RepID=UPI001C05FE42|nr:hypothetical protein [Pelorhabdus rhamnosifermentans]MBU2699278.1 hypothetical protein [Pelorhabdus rhamnosifermentans]